MSTRINLLFWTVHCAAVEAALPLDSKNADVFSGRYCAVLVVFLGNVNNGGGISH